MYPELARRTFLFTALMVSSGCSGKILGGEPQHFDIYVTNQSDINLQYDLTVRSAQQTIIEDSRRLDAEENVENDKNAAIYSNPITKPGRYYLEIGTSTGYALDYWWDENAEPSKQRGDADGLEIHLYEDEPITLIADEETN